MAGNEYIGEWRDGNLNGSGKLIYANNGEYTGTFVDNKKHGYGIFEGAEFKYQGNFIDDRYEGEGELITDSVTGKGIFKKGRIEKGKEMYANGDVFEGQLNWNRTTTRTRPIRHY